MTVEGECGVERDSKEPTEAGSEIGGMVDDMA